MIEELQGIIIVVVLKAVDERMENVVGMYEEEGDDRLADFGAPEAVGIIELPDEHFFHRDVFRLADAEDLLAFIAGVDLDLRVGDVITITAGMPVGEVYYTNTLRVHELTEKSFED